ncbi:MAG: hypothetical protein IKP38_07645 [Clostridia bacterium]|nr:hypothetical protein [Clostridia bacterium]
MKRIIILCLSLALLLACVPTPEEEFVVNKGDGSAAAAGETDERVSEVLSTVPSAWTAAFSFREGTVVVTVDAAIDVPQVDRFPIVEVTPAVVDAQIAAGLLNRLIPNGSILIPNQSGQAYTVEDVDRWIEQVRLLLAHTDEMSFASIDERDAYINTQNAELERLFEMRRTAEEGAVTAVDNYALLKRYGAMQCRVLDARGTECADLLWKPQAEETSDKRESVLHIDALSAACRLADHEIETVEEGRQLADELIDELGISDRYVCVSVMDGKNWICFCYGVQYGGIAASPFTETVIDVGSYRVPWPNEMLQIRLNRNDGRASASYVSPSKIVGELGNAALLPFSEIQEQFEKDMKASYAWMDDGTVSAEIAVTRVSLGYYRVPMKDAPDRYALIPAWTFEGSRTTFEKSDNGVDLFANENDLKNNVLLIISGVDGSLLYAG